jgi:hypothetical protein
MKPSSRIGLGRPVQRMLQGTNRVRMHGSHSGGTSHRDTHRAPPSQHYASTKQRPFPHRRFCCPVGSIGTIAASDAHPARHPLPGIPVIGHAASDDTLRRSPGQGGPLQFPPPPLIRSEPHTPGSPSRLHSRIYTASVAFALMEGARHSLIPTRRRAILTTPQASLHATDRIIAPLLQGF